MGALGWTEAELFATTLPNALAALDGFARFNGAKPEAAPPAREKIEAMMLRFPDAPKGKRR